jgi:hypothetical protein
MARPRRIKVIRRDATQARTQATESPNSEAASRTDSKFDSLDIFYSANISLTCGQDSRILLPKMQYGLL